MPNVPSRVTLEFRDQSGYVPHIGAHSVLPSRFGGRRWFRRSRVDKKSFLELCLIERPAVDNLKLNQVDMDRVRVTGPVNQVPDLDGVDDRRFRNCLIPVLEIEQVGEWVSEGVI